MEVITLSHPHQISKANCFPTAIALGYFDGVHKGHQKVINTAKEIADNNSWKSAVMTFHPHPSEVLGKITGPVRYITPLKDKIKIIEDLGIDYLYLVTFDHAFAELLPQEFVDQYLIGLNVKHVVAGFDFTYGRLGRGTMETLSFHSRRQFEHTTISKIGLENTKISSTLIRGLIREGNVSEIPECLSRYYQMKGEVVHGEKRGRTIGFPTANIDVSEEYLLPPVGVYSVRLKIQEIWYNGVCNIGYKPTFHNEIPERPTIEVHLFNFSEEIYGEEVLLEWHKRIRSEKRFNSIEELISQIKEDQQAAIQSFDKTKDEN